MCRGSQSRDHGEVSNEEDWMHQYRNQRGDTRRSRR